MGIDMIGAVLRVVFEDEDGGVVPVGAMRNGIDYAAEREIVIGDRSLRSWLASARASGVVVRQVEQRELWKFVGGSLRVSQTRRTREGIRRRGVGPDNRY